MKKIINKLAFVSALFTLTSCSLNNGGALSPILPVTEETPFYSTKTLHNVDIKERNLKFFENGVTEYKIIIPKNNSYAEKAALFMKQYIGLAAKGNIEFVEYDESMTYNSHSKYIVFNVPELATLAGVNKTTIDLKITGYQIETKDDSVFIFVNHSYGYQQAAFTFLRRVIGYDRISKRITLYNRKTDTLPEMHIVEIPDYQIRTQSNLVDIDYSYETGFLVSNQVFFNNKQVPFVHNSTSYGAYPGWIPLTEKPVHTDWFADSNVNQLCYTAHGKPEEFEGMVNYLYAKLLTALDEQPDCTKFSITIMDNKDSCKCDACNQTAAKYGAQSAAPILFLNAVDDKLQAHLEEVAEQTNTPKRMLELVFFAYNSYEKPPVKVVDGEYVPTYPEIVCHPNVSVYMAPISANFTKSFFDESNASQKKMIEGWTVVSPSINYWLYETNFSCYLYPYNSFAGMANTYRFVSDKNASYMYNEGQHNNGAVTGFGRFKEYFNQITQFDVNSSYGEIVDHFFTEYFKEAKEPMLKYFYEVQEHLDYLYNEYYGSITGSIYDRVDKDSKYWPKKLLDRWLGYINEAYKAIEVEKNIDLGLYNILRDNINLESIFPRFALLSHHNTKYTYDELHKMRSDFYKDGTALGITHISESRAFSDLKTNWNLE